MKTKLITPDKNQCQALKPNGNTFMTFGGIPERVRCSNKPIVIAYETKKAADGEKGSMSLCYDCLKKFREQMPANFATIVPIKQGEPVTP